MAEAVEMAETKEEAEAVLAERFHEITKKINNGCVGESDRRDYYDFYLNLLKESE